jgi:hypothetical protein
MRQMPKCHNICLWANCARLNLNVMDVGCLGQVKFSWECASIIVWNLFVCENAFPLFAISQLCIQLKDKMMPHKTPNEFIYLRQYKKIISGEDLLLIHSSS